MALLDLRIEGMTCAACSSRIENVLNKIPGVKANVSLLEHRARIEGLAVDDAIAAVRRAGYDAWPIIERDRRQFVGQAASPIERYRLWIAVTAMIPMLIEMVGMLTGHHGIIPIAAQWALATLLQTFVAWPFYLSAWRALRVRSANMESLVSLGTLSAYGWSVINLVNPNPTFYFETSIVVIAMIKIGRHLEYRARGQALEALSHLFRDDDLPVDRWDRTLAKWQPVTARELRIDDQIRIQENQMIPGDGIIQSGQTEIDESALTGESDPNAKAPGDYVYAGSLNLSGVITVTITKPVEESRQALIGERILVALTTRAPIAALADRVAAVFVPVVLVIALLSLLGHWLAGEILSVAIGHAIAVLVVACPCALGLATPAAIAAGLAKASSRGLIFRSAQALERTAQINHIVFDKTGTLTSGRPRLVAITDRDLNIIDLDSIQGSASPSTPWPDWLALAAGAERGIEHPLAGALLAYAAGREITDCGKGLNHPGKGVSAQSGAQDVAVGKPDWIASELKTQSVPTKESFSWAQQEHYLADATAIDVAVNKHWHGRIWIADTLRLDAVAAIRELARLKIPVTLLSGDRASAVSRVATILGITNALSSQTPEDKANYLDALKSEGANVAMVGDGINDASAMAHAHLGVAMASGSSLALETADLSISNPSPILAVTQSLLLAKAVMRRVKENLVFAFGFNALAIPVAAFGGLSPVIAGTIMALSSGLVMANAARILNWRPRII